MKLSEIKDSDANVLRMRYADLFKTVKRLQAGVNDALKSSNKWDGKGDAEDIIDEIKEYLEDLDETMSDVIKKHSKPIQF